MMGKTVSVKVSLHRSVMGSLLVERQLDREPTKNRVRDFVRHLQLQSSTTYSGIYDSQHPEFGVQNKYMESYEDRLLNSRYRS